MHARYTVSILSAQLLFAYAAHGQSPPMPAQPAHGAAYDFAYRILGDRRVAPVQVFDDGRHTYMQFRQGQTVPAIFSAGPQGERLLSHVAKGGYVVIAGTAGQFAMRIGQVGAQAQYQGKTRRMGGDAAAGEETGMPDAFEQLDFDAGASPVNPVAMHGSYAGAPPAVSRAAPAQPGFDAAPADQNMRKTLSRWARAAGWVFEPEHWTVDVDIPLAGAAALGNDFKPAVRALLAATELSARPLQPCFYSNKVLRVVALAEPCNRMAAATTH